jgi:hypothetical protein
MLFQGKYSLMGIMLFQPNITREHGGEIKVDSKDGEYIESAILLGA